MLRGLPAPVPDLDTQPFWDGCVDESLPRAECADVRHAPLAAGPDVPGLPAARRRRWIESRARGSVQLARRPPPGEPGARRPGAVRRRDDRSRGGRARRRQRRGLRPRRGRRPAWRRAVLRAARGRHDGSRTSAGRSERGARGSTTLDLPFDELGVGDTFASRGRTVTEADIVAYAALSGDWTPLHTDAVAAAAGPFGARIAHGGLTLSISTGLEFSLLGEAANCRLLRDGPRPVREARVHRRHDPPPRGGASRSSRRTTVAASSRSARSSSTSTATSSPRSTSGRSTAAARVVERPATYVPVTIADGIRLAARRTPGKLALEEGDRRLAFSELVDRIHRVAQRRRRRARPRRGKPRGDLLAELPRVRRDRVRARGRRRRARARQRTLERGGARGALRRRRGASALRARVARGGRARGGAAGRRPADRDRRRLRRVALGRLSAAARRAPRGVGRLPAPVHRRDDRAREGRSPLAPRARPHLLRDGRRVRLLHAGRRGARDRAALPRRRVLVLRRDDLLRRHVRAQPALRPGGDAAPPLRTGAHDRVHGADALQRDLRPRRGRAPPPPGHAAARPDQQRGAAVAGDEGADRRALRRRRPLRVVRLDRGQPDLDAAARRPAAQAAVRRAAVPRSRR